MRAYSATVFLLFFAVSTLLYAHPALAAVSSGPCSSNIVTDNTKTTQSVVNEKAGSVAVMCENGKFYLVEKKTTSSDCRPTAITIDWQPGVNANTNPELLKNYPPKMFMKDLDGKTKDLGTGCPAGEQLEKSYSTPDAKAQLLTDEVSRVAKTDVDDAVKLQQIGNAEITSGINSAFSNTGMQENQQLLDLTHKVDQVKNDPNASLADLVGVHSDARAFEEQLKASGASPAVVQQAEALTSEAASLTRSRFASAQAYSRIAAEVDAEADRKLLLSYGNTTFIEKQPAASPLTPAPAHTSVAIAKVQPLPPTTRPDLWEELYVDATPPPPVPANRADTLGTQESVIPLPQQRVPDLPERRPDIGVVSSPQPVSTLPPAAQNATTLSQFWQATGESYCSVSCRIQRYGAQCNITNSNYSGTGAQNTALLHCLQG